MTKEILNRGNVLIAKIIETQMELKQIGNLLDEAKEDKSIFRVHGLNIKIPKAIFRDEVRKKKQELEAQLTLLQNEFDSL